MKVHELGKLMGVLAKLSLICGLVGVMGCGGKVAMVPRPSSDAGGELVIHVAFPEDNSRIIPNFATQIYVAVSGTRLTQARFQTATPSNPSVVFQNVPPGEYDVLGYTNPDPQGREPAYAAMAPVVVEPGMTQSVVLDLQPYASEVSLMLIYDTNLNAYHLAFDGAGLLMRHDGAGGIEIIGRRYPAGVTHGRQTFITHLFSPVIRIPANLRPGEQLAPQDVAVLDEANQVIDHVRAFIWLRDIHGVHMPAGDFPQCVLLEIAINSLDNPTNPGDLLVFWLARSFGAVRVMMGATPALSDLTRGISRQTSLGGMLVLTSASVGMVSASETNPITWSPSAYDGQISNYLPLDESYYYTYSAVTVGTLGMKGFKHGPWQMARGGRVTLDFNVTPWTPDETWRRAFDFAPPPSEWQDAPDVNEINFSESSSIPQFENVAYFVYFRTKLLVGQDMVGRRILIKFGGIDDIVRIT